MRIAALVLFVLAAICSSSALGADIYVNGQQVRGITNLTLEDCTVTFNTRGDVYISAPGFQVLETAAKGDQAKGPVEKTHISLLQDRYFLFTQTSSPGKVPFNFEVWINDKKTKEFTSRQDKLTVEVTLYLKKGSNKVEIKSLYQQTGQGSAADSFSIFIGRGAPNKGALEINKLLLNYSRKGNDSDDSSDVVHIDAE